VNDTIEELLPRMQAVILAGGRGTRLEEETEVRPKPMLEIGERPILWHIMKIYERAGVSRFVVCLGYRGEMIKRFFLDYDVLGSDVLVDLGAPAVKPLTSNHDERWEVVLADTGIDTQTGGRIKRVEPYVDGDVFFATYGDGVANLDLRELLRFHLDGGWAATLTGVQPAGRFGHLTIEGDRVRSFVEKPARTDGWVNGGFYVFNREVFDLLDRDCVLEREPLERLANDGRLGIYRHDRYWACMDTARDYEELNAEWATGRAGWTR